MTKKKAAIVRCFFTLIQAIYVFLFSSRNGITDMLVRLQMKMNRASNQHSQNFDKPKLLFRLQESVRLAFVKKPSFLPLNMFYYSVYPNLENYTMMARTFLKIVIVPTLSDARIETILQASGDEPHLNS